MSIGQVSDWGIGEVEALRNISGVCYEKFRPEVRVGLHQGMNEGLC